MLTFGAAGVVVRKFLLRRAGGMWSDDIKQSILSLPIRSDSARFNGSPSSALVYLCYCCPSIIVRSKDQMSKWQIQGLRNPWGAEEACELECAPQILPSFLSLCALTWSWMPIQQHGWSPGPRRFTSGIAIKMVRLLVCKSIVKRLMRGIAPMGLGVCAANSSYYYP